ncbi:beta tubulin, autoregulation binding site [Agrobacterium tumefaciens]|uniref:Beta tubulin, autoregulation binding site n=1 Tax=Agrobacterium tumefaciens TaxID=358 RepID=A0A0D0KXG8_AGRTU|nr:beta tubulin, autoregulation binding site [Agrobacterium tumefaciens]
MKNVPAELAAHLEGEATTTCQCWKVSLHDGAVLGFTEHDEALTFGGVIYLAASGFQAGENDSETGLAAASGEVAGGFSSEAVSEADLAAGRYDGAKVELYLVNWQAPEQHVLLKVREIGEVTRAGGAFKAELRSFAHRLGQPQGRVYGRRCDAALGDARCRANVAAFRATGAVVSINGTGRIVVSGLGGFAEGFFRQGKLAFSSGANAGRSFDLDDHAVRSGVTELSFWLPLEAAPQAGDAFTVTAGCDKSFATCKAKFSNQLNFRGFPHMPGADFAYSYVTSRTQHDGGALF